MRILITAAMLAMAMGSAASAATVTIQTFSAGDYTGGLNASATVEDFETRSQLSGNFEGASGGVGASISGGGFGELAGALGTRVGTFASLGGTGSGTTCGSHDRASNGCTGLALQSGSINGQGNLLPAGGVVSLNSNDTRGILWDVSLDGGSGLFDTLLFAVRDAADVGKRTLSILAGGTTTVYDTATNPGLFGNGLAQLVRINFGQQVTSAQISIETGVNDGFTLDGAAALIADRDIVAPVPLPAGIALLLGGLGFLGAAGRFRGNRAIA
ncbi:VPLPA-CTERM sorting domain-containing protein [Jannaschia sp. LMIT008]|uniref:VPLPA-CTERM sorting domain-containing protein n=1 Tax=Jannaschia maritima TaxID=3032585 RepID=UPI002811E99B|nr:VPLPA-CTERM sorting domain-containing protein [Jannaschia sp. LMIT008]